MRVLVTGVGGQLGHDVMLELASRSHVGIGVDVAEMDITDADAVSAFIMQAKPDAVIHCAAYTATEKAEEEPDVCRAVNAGGTENIATVCRELDIKMLYISTDYVFDGKGTEAFEVDDKAVPLSVYGLTKYEGECAVRKLLDKYFIVRISWVFGINGKNFVRTMLRITEQNNKVSAVNDQIGSPTYTKDLAPLLCDMIQSEKYGTYHATNEGYCSWFDFASEIFRLAGRDVEVTPVSSDFFPSKIKRPENSRLDKSELDKNGFSRLPDWKDALARYMAELGMMGE